jgi:glutamate-1-semialdehyde 2,1-aminomutase
MPLIMISNDDGTTDTRATHSFVDHMLDQGVYFHPNHNMFLNAAMTTDDISATIAAATHALAAVAR